MSRADYALGSTIDFKFTTRRFSTGAPFTLAGTPAVAAYPDNSTTELTAGITLTVDFDARTGLNNVRVVATGGNGYAAGSTYALVLTAGTVDGVSVVGEVVGEFTLERSAAFGRLGAPAGASTAADIAAIKAETASVQADTNDMQTRLPAALVSGRIDASVGAMAAGVVTAAAVATDAIDADALAADAVTEIADGYLKRDMSLVTGEAARSPLNAMRFLRNKWSVAAGTLTVTKEDDTTTAWTAVTTGTAGADPITAVDPA